MKVDPLNDDLRHQLGMTYIAAHEYNKALEVYRLGLTLSPDQIGFRRWMTFSRIALGYNLESALKESGLTNDVWTKIVGYDFVDKSVKVLEAKRKEGKILNADQHDYRPLTLDYALTYYLQGNRDLAKRYADSTASFLLVKQNAMANNYRLFASLGKAHAISGNAKAAVQSGEKATELLPITLDAIDGPYYEQNLAEIYIIMKQYDVALDKIEKLLSIPGYFSVGWMMVNPIYEPLRDLPRFKKLVEKYKYMAKK